MASKWLVRYLKQTGEETSPAISCSSDTWLHYEAVLLMLLQSSTAYRAVATGCLCNGNGSVPNSELVMSALLAVEWSTPSNAVWLLGCFFALCLVWVWDKRRAYVWFPCCHHGMHDNDANACMIAPWNIVIRGLINHLYEQFQAASQTSRLHMQAQMALK